MDYNRLSDLSLIFYDKYTLLTDIQFIVIAFWLFDNLKQAARKEGLTVKLLFNSKKVSQDGIF